jgi:3-oxoacyl-[acyl-carrier protein] reductase
MDLRLARKRALVTGSSAGLGEAIAKFLAAEGAVVVVHGRDIGRTNAVAQAIHAAGGRAEIEIGDLSTDAGADTVASVAQAGGGIDILVNNAGAYHHLTWMEATPDRWVETYQSNVVSCVRMIHRLVPKMKEPRWGRVIQIGGGLAIQPIPMQPDYEPRWRRGISPSHLHANLRIPASRRTWSPRAPSAYSPSKSCWSR